MDSPLRPPPNSNTDTELGRNPTSTAGCGVAAAAGEIDPSSESLAVEPDRVSLFEGEVYGSKPDSSDRKGDNLELACATDSKEAREVDPLPESLAIDSDRSPLLGGEVYGPNLDSSYRKGAELELAGEGFGAGAVNPDCSASKNLELRSSIDRKMEKVCLTDPSYATDSKEDGDGLPMAVDAVIFYPGVEGSAQTSKEGGNGEVSLSAESNIVDEDDATDSNEDSGETESVEPESDDDSSSEESSSSSNSEEDEDGDSHDSMENEKDGEEAFLGSEGEEEDVKVTIKSKNELEELPLVPQIEVTLQPHHQLLPTGAISSILGTRVVVEGSVNHNPLNEGSILWVTDTRCALGLVDEIFGPVKCPYYVVRYNSEKDVPAGISQGTAVSFVMEFANKILNEKDLHKKGYDASGENDEEVNGEVEFSDDEKEAEYKRSVSREKRGIDDKRQGNRQIALRKKKTKSKGGELGRGLQPLLPRGTVATNQPPPGVAGPQASHGANNSAYERGPCSLGSGSAGVSAPPIAPAFPQAINSGDCSTAMPQQFLQQQPNAMWAPGMPPQQQPNAFWPYGMLPQQQPNAVIGGFQMNDLPMQQLGNHVHRQQHQNQVSSGNMNAMPLQQQQPNAIGGFQMNGLPMQQLGNHVHRQQHQNQVSSGNMNVMPLQQQQFLPLFGATANMLWPFRPSNVYAGPMAPWLVGAVGISEAPSMQGNISVQASSVPSREQSYQQISPAIVQGGMPAPLQFNVGSSSVRGKKPHVRGDGHSCGRGGWRRKG